MTEPRGSRRNRLDAGRHEIRAPRAGTVAITVSIPVLMPPRTNPSVNQQHAHQKGTTTMFKTTVTRLFVGSLIALGAGATVSILAIALAIANDVFVMDGNDIAAIQGGALAWALLGLAFLGTLTAAGGVIAGFIAWIGAVLNTWQLESKAWFVALVLTGIFNFGFIAMVIYVIAGPDGKAARIAQPAAAPVGA
jgi:hypothetical protein